ncbi:Na+/H+ antiporter subunit D [Agrococcus jejuensis]|uniref:Multisubunit sodium/proton antiporter, MrpD subunit n=1 Tax=Agrococcus jejuensis TaxID=399736 RepID=A0A1G8G493_9MICO|nr:Na+/H+ antiporter subunit D [Agrococcus jejuensis]SDH89214.1 multisubunit sodium/proton antiporter, MrpD subunit [Agrococcus jejuensis]
MDAVNLIPLPVLLPLIGAGIAMCFPRSPRVQRIVSATSLTLVLVVAALLVWQSTEGPQALWVGAWPEGLGIVLVADRLSSLMVLVSSIVTITVLVFATRQDQDAGTSQAPVSIFHPTYLVLSAGVANAFLSGDLFNLFVGFEMLLFASYVLLTLGAPRERVRAGSTYIVVSIVSSTLFLIAIAVVYAAVGTVNFAQMSERLPELGEGIQLTIQLLLLTVFAIKAAIFPLSSWLPDSYPTAPASVTAVFAGLLTKVGVYAIIRLQTLLFPDSPLTDLLLWAALATMIVGILGALAQNEIKRLLSFTLVSHIGYMVLGIGLASEAGLAGSIFYVAHHILIQTALFLVVGLIERAGGSTSMSKIGGLAAVPVLAVLFFVPAINLAGLPPFSGFLGKVALFQAGIAEGTPLAYALVFGGIATSLLTLLAIIRVWHRAFWEPEREEHPEHRRLPASWLVTAGALVAITCAISVVAGPLSTFATDAAHDLRDQTYVTAVEEAMP